jgi:maltose-binding protein MalE
MKNKVLIMLLGLFMFVLMTGCSQIEDTNGSETGLETITEAEILGGSFSSSSVMSKTSSKRVLKTLVGQYEDLDNDVYEMTVGKFSGISNIHVTQLSEGDSLTLDYETTQEAGNVRIVLVAPNDQIIYDFKLNSSDSFSFVAEESGEYFVRIAGESFKGSIEIERVID